MRQRDSSRTGASRFLRFPLFLPPSGGVTLTLYVEAEYFSVHCNNIKGIFCDAFEVASTAVWSAP